MLPSDSKLSSENFFQNTFSRAFSLWQIKEVRSLRATYLKEQKYIRKDWKKECKLIGENFTGENFCQLLQFCFSIIFIYFFIFQNSAIYNYSSHFLSIKSESSLKLIVFSKSLWNCAKSRNIAYLGCFPPSIIVIFKYKFSSSFPKFWSE